MKLSRSFCLSLAALGFASMAAPGAGDPDPGQVSIAVARLLENVHYSKLQLNDAMSQRLLRNYLDALDYNHLFFTQEDVEAFTQQWGDKLDDEILAGRTLAAHQIHDLFRKRVEERIAYAKELLASELSFNTDRSVEINRQKVPWPSSESDARLVWKDRITSELLQERLAKKKTEPTQAVGKRYDQFIRNLQEQTSEDVVKTFLLSLAQTYDPHSEYLSKNDLEQFSINMRLSLFGIGAKLRSEDGYAKIWELVPGGPALKSGKIKVGDRIVSVAQGDKEFVDCVDMKLDKIVNMIRGKKDTIVRIQLIPVDATNGTERHTVEIKRDEVKLKDEEARAELIEWTKPNGQTVKLGIIVLPSFYGDPERNSNPNAKSTTRDVLALLNRLKQEGIQGLVMDLRRDGGGFLDEAVNLTGLFIKKGPVVQARDWKGEVTLSRDKDPTISYDGPMLVLVNRQSASASEIFAGAMQDYGRAIIVGDTKTFGKGTVQQMIELSRAVPFLANGSEAGAVKLTIQKFYRVAGGSTQLRGVESDIVLPSIYDQSEIGEESLKDPLPYDTFTALEFDKWEKPLHLDELRRRSSARIPLNPEFSYVVDDLARIRKRMADNRISLNEQTRQAELDDDKQRKEKRETERKESTKDKDPKVYRLTLENVAKKELVPVKFVEPKSNKETPALGDDDEAPSPDALSEPQPDKDGRPVFKSAPIRLDPVKQETLNILSELVDLAKMDGSSTAKKK
ncbi:MAG: carboxyl-terminal processing protease [Verrucomicrobia bacterium]|nr:MAG: carboxyl-terminal processing protease [Verrucomicrobiota bacterium]